MEHVALVGIKPMEFYEMTPREIENYVNGQIRRIEIDHEMSITNAWLSVVLERQKRLPKLEELIKKKQRKIKVQTEEEMFEMVKILNAALGGEMIENRN
jgi:hypothetical protein